MLLAAAGRFIKRSRFAPLPAFGKAAVVDPTGIGASSPSTATVLRLIFNNSLAEANTSLMKAGSLRSANTSLMEANTSLTICVEDDEVLCFMATPGWYGTATSCLFEVDEVVGTADGTATSGWFEGVGTDDGKATSRLSDATSGSNNDV